MQFCGVSDANRHKHRTYLDEAHVKWILITPSPSNASDGLALCEPIETDQFEHRARDSVLHSATDASNGSTFVIMVMVVATWSTWWRWKRAEVDDLSVRPRFWHRSEDSGFYGATLVSQRGTSAASHEAIHAEIGHLICCHLPGNLPQVTDTEDGSPGELQGCPYCDRQCEGII